MAALLIKDLPPPLHASLRQRAERNHRSMAKEVLTILEQAVTAACPPVPPLKPQKTFALPKPLSAAFVTRIIRTARDRRP